MNPIENINPLSFRESLRDEYDRFLEQQQNRFDDENCLRIDLHCHDQNSDIPDELWGRILGLPETWLKTKKLVKCLKSHGCNVVTVTNHNNARSCWELREKGEDVLSGTEFTCYFNEYNLFVHILAFGFDQQQEVVLNEKRKDVYDFLKYAAAENVPVILPHPLYFYTRNDKIDLALFEKMAVMFQRFEVLNGQRDQWQSVLTLNWAQSLTAEKIRSYAAKHNLDPADYGVDPDQPKVLTGGSDDHMGIFAGQCGSRLYVPNLKQRLKKEKASDLALEAIREGRIAPFGHVSENQKLSIALLDYFSQVATKMEDPGLLRILFHRGEVSDKLACLTFGNMFMEMQKSKTTMKFFDFIHDALQGKKPSKLLKWKVKKDYRFCIDYLEKIAESKQKGSSEHFVETVNQSILELFERLVLLIIRRTEEVLEHSDRKKMTSFSTEELTRHFEVPSQISALLKGGNSKPGEMSSLSLGQLFKSLRFPAMVAIILAGTTLGSTRLLYQNRRFLNEFTDYTGKNHHPKKALYLTDTLRDKNGVSNSLSAKLLEIQQQDLPVDFLICHESAEEEPHLHVLRPLTTFSFPDFGEQVFRIPDIMQVAKIFYEGGYDRVVCSTEGPMALVSLFLKHMFNVPSYFFMHTDWMEFIRETTDLNQHERDRIRRALRFFYKQYSGVFVLNQEHREWLIGHQMELEADKVFLTAHHTAPVDESIQPISKQELFADADDDTPVLLFASRISKEKGIFDLPDIFEQVRQTLPDVRLVIAGSGPAQEELQKRLPEAHFTGWLDRQSIRSLYAGLDMMVFPSRFDTFGNVILEAFTYGMPVISYDCKGPKDIIEHEKSGFLVETKEQMAARIIQFLQSADMQNQMRRNAKERVLSYQADPIMSQFMVDLGLVGQQLTVDEDRSVAGWQ